MITKQMHEGCFRSIINDVIGTFTSSDFVCLLRHHIFFTLLGRNLLRHPRILSLKSKEIKINHRKREFRLLEIYLGSPSSKIIKKYIQILIQVKFSLIMSLLLLKSLFFQISKPRGTVKKRDSVCKYESCDIILIIFVIYPSIFIFFIHR